jgi:hypothetical protein
MQILFGVYETNLKGSDNNAGWNFWLCDWHMDGYYPIYNLSYMGISICYISQIKNKI